MAKVTWANDGNADESGEFRVELDMQDGSGVQVFSGKDHKELADKLIEAQVHATAKIRELSQKTETPDTTAPPEPPRPRPLTADERFSIAADMTDPEKAPEAIAKVVEAATGVNLETLGKKLTQEEMDEQAEKAQQAALEFAQETADYLVTPHNSATMVNYMQLHKMNPLVKKNYVIAWEDLKKAGLVTLKTGTTEPPADPKGGLPEGDRGTRPRNVGATGIRRGDSTLDTPPPPKPKYTREQIEAMPSSEYRTRLTSEPGFQDAVNAIFGGTPAAR